MIEVYHVPPDMAWGRFLLEEVTTARNAVGERKRGDDDGAVFVNDLWSFGINLVEDNLVRGVGTEVVDLWLEYTCEVLWPVDVEVLDASEQAKGGEHADESKHMVAMQVSEKDGLQMGETEASTAQRHLGAFSTIEHEEFFTDVDYLRRTETFWGGECGSATEYVNVESFHEEECRNLKFCLLGVPLAEMQEVAIGTMFLIGTLGEDAQFWVIFV